MNNALADGYKVQPMIKSVFFRFSLFFFGLVIISSCYKIDNTIDEAYFALQKPFGLTWDVTDKYASDPESDCNQLIKSLSSVINSSQKEKALLECNSREHSTVYIPAEEIPQALNKGEISVGLLGGKKPVQYTYSFLHDWTPDKLAKKSKLRKAHAAGIKAQLIQLYGLPNTNGYFDQGTQFGYVVENEIHQPCSFWLINDIGILLCSERVIMVDGTEMSLSFIRFDEDVVGKEVRNMALIASGAKPEPNGTEPKTVTISGYSKPVLRKLADLVYSDEFNRCGKSGLVPIQNVWAQSQSYNAKLENIYAKYSGDELAEFVFENSHQLEDKIPDIEQGLAMMLLLKHAAQQGSASAMNEIGASLLHCYQGIQQDVGAAEEWLDKAAKAGDAMAMQTLASMRLANLTDSESPKNEALTLLDQCSQVSPEICAENFETLKSFMKSARE